MKVTVVVPDGLRYQLVYRLEKDAPYSLPDDEQFRTRFIGSGAAALAHFALLSRVFGHVGAAKAVAKLATPRRQLYILESRSGFPASYGWGMIGRCGYYKIEPHAVVIGPISTESAERGKGLATRAMQQAINCWIARGVRVFYIDTECENFAAQRVFAKCGFSEPVALYLR